MRATSGAQQVPRLKGSPVLGSMGEIRRDYLGTISRAVREVGGLARITVGPPGMQIAMLGIPILLAAVLGAFTLETQLTSIPVHAAITLQPTGALPLRLRSV